MVPSWDAANQVRVQCPQGAFRGCSDRGDGQGQVADALAYGDGYTKPMQLEAFGWGAFDRAFLPPVEPQPVPMMTSTARDAVLCFERLLTGPGYDRHLGRA